MHKARAVLGAEMPPPVVVVPSPEPSGHYSIVIPAFNEGRRIEATICTIVAYMETHHGRYEIVVSDDGSTGSTRDIVEELLQKGASHHVGPVGAGSR